MKHNTGVLVHVLSLRLVVGVCLGIASGLASRSGASNPNPTPPAQLRTPTSSPKPKSVTQAYGAIPESLAGLWITVTNTKVGPDKVRNNFQLYRIRKEGHHWHFLRVPKPNHVGSLGPLIAAEQQLSPFQPTKDQLAALRADRKQLLELLPSPEAETFKVVHLRAGDAIPAEPPPPPEAAGALLAIEFLEQPPSGASLSAVSLYVKKIGGDQMEGDFRSLTLLGLSQIVFTGRFVMYRLD